MTDLTPQFNQCVDIVTSEIKPPAHPLDHHTSQQGYLIKDTFAKECREFYAVLVDLNQFITKIKTDYLAISESKANSITKDKIDEDFNLKIQQCFKKLAVLESYETKRQEMVKSILPSKRLWSVFTSTGSGGSDEQSLYFDTVWRHRKQILRFLMESLTFVSKKFDKMQRKRSSRERQLNSLNFQDIDEDDDILNVDLNSASEPFLTSLDSISQAVGDDDDEEQVEEDQSYDAASETQAGMSQQQLQMLEEENKELLNLKNTQSKQVDKIQHSIMDIINIQNELSFKLQEQGDQINNLIDSHSEVEMEVAAGNKTLNKATRSNKRGSNLLVMICVILGCLLVIIDFLKFI
ncbi:uncharacterized protein LODBEIA_P60690 [Lodderomyces beijingensis]|uniref:t-SNARE coiled-coil homology domain-containing protein n=1 Tax=Lodderomyces beijingensis TaxID=1775926 RepID=A0ABP0ZUM5_9ASCO